MIVFDIFYSHFISYNKAGRNIIISISYSFTPTATPWDVINYFSNMGVCNIELTDIKVVELLCGGFENGNNTIWQSDLYLVYDIR